ncbi:MAG: hypothetical protein L6263_05070 [Desulfobacteraceae bacterium]|nr:hypothetical protein [Desulfobacteraceae bacterium]
MSDESFTLKFLSEIELDFSGVYPSRICTTEDYLFIPIPKIKKIIRLDYEMNVKMENFFSGDQRNPLPYCFNIPDAITFSHYNGYCVCDKAKSNILFFDQSGVFKYAKSPPGFVECDFNQPENIASLSSHIAIIDAGLNLHILDSFGILETCHIQDLPGSEHIKAGSLSGFDEKFYLITQNANLIAVDPFTRRIERITLPLENIKGKPEAVCFDQAGNLYIILTEPAALIMLDSECLDIIATYERFGYNCGELRVPKCIEINKRMIYIIDDNRLMKFQLINHSES